VGWQHIEKWTKNKGSEGQAKNEMEKKETKNILGFRPGWVSHADVKRGAFKKF